MALRNSPSTRQLVLVLVQLCVTLHDKGVLSVPKNDDGGQKGNTQIIMA